jgi:nicotinate-nucleotide pyrophosphorylase (carboxylating)
MNLSPELHSRIATDVRNALAEDIGAGDLTANLVPAEQQASARLIVREAAVICGTAWFDQVFASLSDEIAINWQVADGDKVSTDDLLCELAGPARALLTGERAAMNFLQTLSATATTARQYADAVSSTNAVILDTRKTIPGLRLAQKYAVVTGGAQNHRVGLYDGILIKENHIASCGGIANAVQQALAGRADVLLEVEVESLAEAREAIESGAQRLLLDNFPLADMRTAVTLRDQLNKAVGLEASGNVTLLTVADVAATGIDFISIGALTKDIKAIDLSMRFAMN